MSRTVIDLDDDIVEEAMRLYDARTKAGAVRAALEDAVRRRLRMEFADAVKSGELDFAEIIESTGPAGDRGKGRGSDAA